MANVPSQFPTALQKCYKIKKGPISKKYYYTPTLVSLTQDELTLFKIKDVSPSPISRRMITGAEELPSPDKNKFVIKVCIEVSTEQQVLLLAFDKKEIATALVAQLNSKNDFNSQLELLKINPNQIEKDTEIGRGAFGIVWKGKFAGGPVAIKEVLTTMNEDKILKEITLLSKINHPNCVRLLGFYKEENNDNKLFIVTELIENGDLHDCIFKKFKNHQISEIVKLKILRDVASGILYLHENDVIHRDLKSDNCLVRSVSPSAYQFAVLADFGVSKLLNSAEVNTQTIGIGTPVYMAPDCFKENYTFALDVYSFGVLINEVFSEERPWAHVDTKWTYVLFEKVEKGERPRVLFTEMKDKYPNASKIMQLVEKCWQTEPEKRPKMKEVIQDLNNIIQTSVNPKDDKLVEEQLQKKDVAQVSEDIESRLKLTPGSSAPSGLNAKKAPAPPRRATIGTAKADASNPTVNPDSNKFNDNIALQYTSNQDAYSSTPSIHNPQGTTSPYNSGGTNFYTPPSSPAHPAMTHTGTYNYHPNTYAPPNPYATAPTPPTPFLPSYPSAPDLMAPVIPAIPDYYQYGTYMPPPLATLPSMSHVYNTSMYPHPNAPPSPWLSNLPQIEPCHDIISFASNYVYSCGGLLRADFQQFLQKYTNPQDAATFTGHIAEIFESNGAYIRYESLQKLATYFFPIASDVVPGLSVSNVNSVFSCGYFKGYLAGSVIETTLKASAAPGQYVIRFSTAPGCVSLDVLDHNRTCVHLKVQLMDNGRVNDQGIIHESIFNWLKYRTQNSYSFPGGASVKLTTPFYM